MGTDHVQSIGIDPVGVEEIIQAIQLFVIKQRGGAWRLLHVVFTEK
ncbi:hypothetical protein [Modicisalibacter luteus]